jgi:hypothetical protein
MKKIALLKPLKDDENRARCRASAQMLHDLGIKIGDLVLVKV